MIFLERGSKIRVRADVRQNFGLKCALTWWHPLGISQVLRDSRMFQVCFATTTVVSCFGHQNIPESSKIQDAETPSNPQGCFTLEAGQGAPGVPGHLLENGHRFGQTGINPMFHRLPG